MTRRTGLLIGTAFLAGIAVGPTTGWILRHSGQAHAQDAATGATPAIDKFHLLELFGNVYETVRNDYVAPINDQTAIENAIEGMVGGLDPHSAYMNAKEYTDFNVQMQGQFGGLGLEVTQEDGIIKVQTPIDDTPASRAGIKSGDYITALDGVTVEGMTLDTAVGKMRGDPGTKITLTIKRQGIDTPILVSLTREIIRVDPVKSATYNDVGYIRLAEFTDQAGDDVQNAFEKLKSTGHLKALILDLRNNPGGALDQAVRISNDFLSEGEIVSTRARHPQDSTRDDAVPQGDIAGNIPLVVLINNGSASASEIVAGALQDHRRAVVIGEQSFGKGSVQTVLPLGPGDGALRLTTARYYTPSGRSIQGLGITPDILVRESAKDIATFGPAHETDLNGIIANQGGTPNATAVPKRDDLPAIAKSIPSAPPSNWPDFDATKPATDFQLQQALTVARAMESQQH